MQHLLGFEPYVLVIEIWALVIWAKTPYVIKSSMLLLYYIHMIWRWTMLSLRCVFPYFWQDDFPRLRVYLVFAQLGNMSNEANDCEKLLLKEYFPQVCQYLMCIGPENLNRLYFKPPSLSHCYLKLSWFKFWIYAWYGVLVFNEITLSYLFVFCTCMWLACVHAFHLRSFFLSI